jgi:uncharacterized protein YjbI with pentapeptide repeats
MRNTRVERKKPGRKSKSGLKKESGRWRPTTRQVLWAIALVVALVTITLLVANLYPAIWQDISRERVAMLIGIGVALVMVIVLVAIGGASLGWTGFGDKTLWDWLQLLSSLAIPVVLAAAGLWFTAQQDARQQDLEDRRAASEQKIAEQRAQDDALQAYFDQMSGLMLGKELRSAEEDSEVAILARARTLTVLSQFDPSHQRRVVLFLAEAQLIQRPTPVVSLASADLRGTDLHDAMLDEVSLSNANLSGADLSGAILDGAGLIGTNLTEADLSGADLNGAVLSCKGPSMTKYASIYILPANKGDCTTLKRAILIDARLSGADLWGAKLGSANLTNVFMPGAFLKSANLSNATLTGAFLSGSNLKFANLEGAKVGEDLLWSLQHQTKSMDGATMPNGQSYEEWLKDKEGRGGNRKNSDSS